MGGLIIEDKPVILDLMASWDSHIPKKIRPEKVIGLGLNINELKKNKALRDYVFHDLNENPVLPFDDNSFDAVINTVSVDYMTKPVQVFGEVGRVLKPGGIFIVIFSNRMFPQKAVKVWKSSSEEERLILVDEFFKATGKFENTSTFISTGKPRPEGDKYAHTGVTSDPIYAVYADKKGGKPSGKKRPVITIDHRGPVDEDFLKKRKAMVKETLRCPHCEEKLKKWAVPDNPFACTWDNDYMYICFNDSCPYYVRGWDFMSKEGNRGTSYRLMYNPVNDCCLPIPVTSPKALKGGIFE